MLARQWLVVVCAVAAAGGAAADERSFDCVLDPSETLRLGSPSSGILADVLSDRGEAVARGQPVARLSDSVEAATVRINRALADDRTAIETAKARAALAKSQLDRVQSLVAKHVASTQNLEELQAALDIAELELEQAKNGNLRARLELERSQAILDQRTVRSPIDGVVVSRDHGPGEYVHQDTSILTVAAVDPLHVEAYLPAALHDGIAVGDRASVRPMQPDGQGFDATVVIVDDVLNAASGTFGVRLTLANPDGAVPAGQRCTVTFRPDGES